MARIRPLTAAVLASVTALGSAAYAAAPTTHPSTRLPFTVGAAVTSITPPPFGTLANDPADCIAGTPLEQVYNGPRLFAFEDPYIDENGDGHYDLGDPYIDCAHAGRWVGNFLGGGGNTPRYYNHVADPVTARAMVVGNGRTTTAVEVVDNEGLFNVFADRIREKVLADGDRLGAIEISSTHDESAPDTIGLGGVNAATSGTNPFYVDYLVNQSAAAIEAAYRAMQPARIRYVEAIEPANLRQCWSSYPYVDDPIMPTLQAVNAAGHAIVTLTSVSQHAETLGFNPDPVQADWVSGDWPHFFRDALQNAFGGVGIEIAGFVGSVETPEVWSGSISRTPQQFVDEGHPAGCRTLFDASGTMTPTGYNQETTALGQDLAGAVVNALNGASPTWSRSDSLWSASQDVCVPLTNALFLAAAGAGVFGERPGYPPGCPAAVPAAPNGSTLGDSILTQVGAFQIGDGGFLELPGEVFPFTYLRGFLGPEDMPNPSYGLPAWPVPYLRTPYRFFDGLAGDMVGYIFPKGNGVGVPGEDPVNNPQANSTDRFGCGHSDDSESAGSGTADLLGSALVSLLQARFGASEPVGTGRYVLGDGVLSRNPLGVTDSIGCTVNTTFDPVGGPAVAVWLADGQVVYPAAWLSLSGRPQPVPDRDTRGYLTRDGVRHWLDVFADIPGEPASAPVNGQPQ